MNRIANRLFVRYLLASLAVLLLANTSWAVTPESPEVREVLKKAFVYLDANTDERLGGKCLIGLAYLKDGADEEHPKVKDGVDACLAATRGEGAQIRNDIYSTGIAIIFLCTLNPSKYAGEILKLKESLEVRQKPHGGWGYPERETGDTSMTQYGVLSYWEMQNVGFPLSLDSMERVTNWLIRTQDPNGNWGYQGKEGEEGTRLVLIKQDNARLGMTAAGLGCTYMTADLLKLSELNAERDERLPPALKPIKQGQPQQALTNKVNVRWLTAAQDRGRTWMRENYKIDPTGFTHYYLYALERYQSFYEAADGKIIKEPKWYNDGYAFLKRTQAADGSWHDRDNLDAVNTAFGILFLLRSTKKAIQRAKSLGEGELLAGRGVPGGGDVRLRGGQILAREQAISAVALVDVLCQPQNADFAAVASDPELLRDKILAAKEPERTEQLVRIRRLAIDGVPEARLAAIRTLALTRNLDGCVALIAALDDPDWPVVIAADEALRFIARKTASVDLGVKPNGSIRASAIQFWKDWYLTLKPDADFDN